MGDAKEDSRWTTLIAQPFKEQAVFWLNAFWSSGAELLAEQVFRLCGAFTAAAASASATGLDDAAAKRLFAMNVAAGVSPDAVPQRPLALVAFLLAKCAVVTVEQFLKSSFDHFV